MSSECEISNASERQRPGQAESQAEGVHPEESDIEGVAAKYLGYKEKLQRPEKKAKPDKEPGKRLLCHARGHGTIII
jgi:hypothetical protein